MTEREEIHVKLLHRGYKWFGSEWLGSQWIAWAWGPKGRNYEAAFNADEVVAWRDVLEQTKET